MQLDGDDLLAQIRTDFPVEYELAQLRLLTTLQAREIDRLTALTQPGYTPTPRPFLDNSEARLG